jgi:DNA-binding beta-propeller fold protein YncE
LFIILSYSSSFDVVQFDIHGAFQSQVFQFGTEELRSIAYDSLKNILYIANENEDAVLAYDTQSGEFDKSLDFANITDPIGLFIDPSSRLIFIGSSDSPSAVFVFNLDSRQLIQTLGDEGLNHPAGIVSQGEKVWVISQKDETLLLFNLTSGNLISTVIGSFPDTPEQIFFSPC